MKYYFVIFLLLLLVSPNLLAGCYKRSENYVQPEILVKMTPNIVLAKVLTQIPTGDFSVYKFKTIEILKGKAESEFDVPAMKYDENLLYDTLDDHHYYRFWSTSTGRIHTSLLPPCALVVPGFNINKTYLLFADGIPDSKMYEAVDNTLKDKWYKFVKEYLDFTRTGIVDTK